MLDEQAIVSIERLRDDLDEFRRDIGRRYPDERRQVVSDDLRKQVASLGERGAIEIAGRTELSEVVRAEYLADLSVRFQRLLSYSERATVRSKYDKEIRAILRGFRAKLVVPVKLHIRERPLSSPALTAQPRAQFVPSAFVGHSFAPVDRKVVEHVVGTLEALGFEIKTGERPTVDSVSAKVRRRIESQAIFVGIFSRREKLSGREEWTTSDWVIEEKAYAIALRKKLILIKEDGVGSIGGIQGDLEYIEFSKSRLDALGLRLLELFEVAPTRFRA